MTIACKHINTYTANMIKVITNGSYNLLHQWHINLLYCAQDLTNELELICNGGYDYNIHIFKVFLVNMTSVR